MVKLGNLPHIKKTPYIKGFFTTLLWLDQWNIPKKEEKIWASGGGRSEYQQSCYCYFGGLSNSIFSYWMEWYKHLKKNQAVEKEKIAEISLGWEI